MGEVRWGGCEWQARKWVGGQRTRARPSQNKNRRRWRQHRSEKTIASEIGGVLKVGREDTAAPALAGAACLLTPQREQRRESPRHKATAATRARGGAACVWDIGRQPPSHVRDAQASGVALGCICSLHTTLPGVGVWHHGQRGWVRDHLTTQTGWVNKGQCLSGTGTVWMTP
jgi:hypothetical protein